MIFLGATIVFVLLNFAMVTYFTHRRGWTNFYLVSLGMSLAALVLGVVGFLA